MSSIATFTRLPTIALGQLQTDFDAVMEQYGQVAAEYNWGGDVLATLLPLLDEHGVALMDSPHNELTQHLSGSREATIFVFTHAQKEMYLERLAPIRFSADALRDYFNEFNETHEPEVGQAMIDGIEAIRQSLSVLDADSVILLSIG
ncbi:MAG: hypothetical protein ACO1QR_07165 [Chthoniobacteraceae bacterium]